MTVPLLVWATLVAASRVVLGVHYPLDVVAGILLGSLSAVGDIVYVMDVEGEIGETKFREKVSMKAFGPVDNGTQHLYGLDYRMAAWRAGEENPFHTEVGYWLWDGETGEVMRCFMVPRGSTLIAASAYA